MSESVDLAILYEQPMHEKTILFSGLLNHFLDFENITDEPKGGDWRSCLLSSRYERCFFDEFVRLGSLTVFIPDEDSYLIFSEGDGSSGFLVSSDDNKESNASSDRWAVPAGWFHVQQLRTPATTPTATESTPFVVSSVFKTVAL
jgi:hypothetical protein